METLTKEYIDAWRIFYPSRALAEGDLSAAPRFETVDPKMIDDWILLNRKTVSRLKEWFEELSLDDRIDADLLMRQTLSEIERWDRERVHIQSPSFYSGLISQALTYLLARNDLPPSDRVNAVLSRLKGVRNLCRFGKEYLKNGRPHSSAGSIQALEGTTRFFKDNLPGILEGWDSSRADEFEEACRLAAEEVRGLAAFIQDSVLPQADLPDAEGEDVYARKLAVFSGTDLTPDKLERIALEEIDFVRSLITKKASSYWDNIHPGVDKPADEQDLLQAVMEDMESHRESNQADFLQLFKNLIDRAEVFIEKNDIATRPGKRTLITALSPAHFAGAAVGGVYATGPFNPDADTLFYLPTIPDDTPAEVKEGFYRSFNNPFNTMITTHEIYPGHYMQLKIAAGHPRKVRALFADGLYIEGWATLCEVITLDAGWNGFDPLDRLAHLRKRLENAVRAYASVVVHCRGWDRDRLLNFAVERGLLAPQFAVNLWDRVNGSPYQLTSYFLGFRRFTELLQEETSRLGNRFQMKKFCDTVLAAGGIPLRFIPDILFQKNETPDD